MPGFIQFLLIGCFASLVLGVIALAAYKAVSNWLIGFMPWPQAFYLRLVAVGILALVALTAWSAWVASLTKAGLVRFHGNPWLWWPLSAFIVVSPVHAIARWEIVAELRSGTPMSECPSGCLPMSLAILAWALTAFIPNASEAILNALHIPQIWATN